MPRIYTGEEILKRIRRQFIMTRSVPLESDFTKSFTNAVRKTFGPWESAVKKATGASSARHYWSDDEILILLKGMYLRQNKFPSWDEVRKLKPSLTETIRTRFGGLDEAMERAISNSLRLEIFRALEKLTPIGCPDASTNEIQGHLQSRDIDYPAAWIGKTLSFQREKGFVIGRLGGKVVWWQLTDKGRNFILDSRLGVLR